MPDTSLFPGIVPETYGHNPPCTILHSDCLSRSASHFWVFSTFYLCSFPSGHPVFPNLSRPLPQILSVYALFFGGLEQSLVLELLHIFILSNTSVRYKKHNKIHCISFRTLLNYFLVDTKISAEYTKGVVLKMSKLSLAGE